MAQKSLIPKQRTLQESESQSSFESWKESMIFHICLDPKSARFTSDLKTWDSSETRGFTDDSNNVAENKRMTMEAKKSLLNFILGSISMYAPVISASFIKTQCTSLEAIWDRLRGYYGFRKTGSRVLDLPQLRMNANESREGLWERLNTFTQEILLTKDGGVRHENTVIAADEAFTPALQNILVAMWLNIINPALPALVQQRFSTQLRNNTVFSIRDEISDSIPVLLAEMQEREGLINRAGSNNYSRNRAPRSKYQPNKRNCCLCEAAGRPSASHYLSSCPFLPPNDKKFLSKAREISAFSDEEDSQEEVDENIIAELSMNRKINLETMKAATNIKHKSRASSRRVDIVPSPVLRVRRNGKASFWTLDCGAEASLITEEECLELNIRILPTRQQARMADGSSRLPVIGEVHFTAQWGHHDLIFSGLVVRNLDSPVLAGMPFLRQNDISIRYSTNTIFLGDCCSINYRDKKTPKEPSMKSIPSVLRVTNQTCVFPGEEIFLPLPENLQHEKFVALEPRSTVPTSMPSWITCNILCPNPDGEISLSNNTSEPILISKHTQLCQVRPVDEVSLDSLELTSQQSLPTATIHNIPLKNQPLKPSTLSIISVDPSEKIMSVDQRNVFTQIHKRYEKVFSPGIGKYNNHSGNFVHTVNLGPNLPPQRRGRIPTYNRSDKEILQQKFDDLLEEGVFVRAEDINVTVEYVHPSFLVKKPSGGHRLVTSFGEVAEHARPQPTVNSNVEHVLQQIGQYKYIIKSDLSSAYYQIPLSPDSSKYVGTLTPFKGTLVYQRCVMGLPGSEAALDELLSRIFGDIIKEGRMIKMCDDLYVGSNTIDSLASTWEEVLERLLKNGLKLSTDKTVICPTTTVILGWQWNNGFITPTTHRMNALAACNLPKSVKELRSFIGCFKFISRVLPCYAVILQPLEEFAGGKSSSEKLNWTEDLIASFNKAKSHLKKAKPVALPRSEDQLHIVTDASVSGLASALYITKGGKPILAGYFNQSIKKDQCRMIPCEAEALAISASIKHFSYYITQSSKRTRILTDSRPCVLAYRKLMRGEFSSSSKVTTFLSLASRYAVEIMHISGVSNVFSDFASRSPIECQSQNCQICQFVTESNNSTVGEVKISDFISGKAKIPFQSKESWISIQQSCPDLSRVHHCLTTGATLPKKNKYLTDVKRYMSCGATLSSNQKVVVIKQSTPFRPISERVVIPREISAGLMTALHIQLNHPSTYQLTQIFTRGFFCLDMNTVAKKVVEGCHTCAALKKIPSSYHSQTTSVPAKTIGVKFAIDIIKREGQLIMLIREDISSYSDAMLIHNEKAETLRDAIIILMSKFRSPMSPQAILRTDPALGFRSLLNDPHLQKQNLHIELGEPKNINKNPVAEKAIEEFHCELVRLQPAGGKISPTVLAQAISNLNGRIRYNKLSAAEIWTQRDMSTGKKLSLCDEELIERKYLQRTQNHHSSAKYKARGKEKLKSPQNIRIGQLVYLYSDRSKLKSRDKYLIVQIAGEEVQVRKFTNAQFRQRVYRVKKSDLIILPEFIDPPYDFKPMIPFREKVKTQPPLESNIPTPHHLSEMQNVPKSCIPQTFNQNHPMGSRYEGSDSDSSDDSSNSLHFLHNSELNPRTRNESEDSSDEYESPAEEVYPSDNDPFQMLEEELGNLAENQGQHEAANDRQADILEGEINVPEGKEAENTNQAEAGTSSQCKRPPFVVSIKRGRRKIPKNLKEGQCKAKNKNNPNEDVRRSERIKKSLTVPNPSSQ